MADGSLAAAVKDTAVTADVGNQTPATDMADGSPDADVALGPRLLIRKVNQLV